MKFLIFLLFLISINTYPYPYSDLNNGILVAPKISPEASKRFIISDLRKKGTSEFEIFLFQNNTIPYKKILVNQIYRDNGVNMVEVITEDIVNGYQYSTALTSYEKHLFKNKKINSNTLVELLLLRFRGVPENQISTFLKQQIN